MRLSIFRRRIPKYEGMEVVKFGIRIDTYCDFCGSPAGWDTFKLPTNRKEFNTSGMCQICQDEVKTQYESLSETSPKPT